MTAITRDERDERRRLTTRPLLTLSLMPADLDAQLDPQQMADLIAFIRGAR